MTLFSHSDACRSSHTRKTAQARQTEFCCQVCGGGSRGRRDLLENTPRLPQSRPTAARHRLGASLAGSKSGR